MWLKVHTGVPLTRNLHPTSLALQSQSFSGFAITVKLYGTAIRRLAFDTADGHTFQTRLPLFSILWSLGECPRKL